jgi:hypothetical protein
VFGLELILMMLKVIDSLNTKMMEEFHQLHAKTEHIQITLVSNQQVLIKIMFIKDLQKLFLSSLEILFTHEVHYQFRQQ